MLERAGFEYIFMGGDVTFGTMMAKPGTYLSTTEKAFFARYFVRAVNLPALIDADEVCGRGPAFAEKAVEEYIAVGLAGMDIDDRQLQEERGSGDILRERSGMSLMSTEAMVDKIGAITELKKKLDPDFVLRVRCYAFREYPLDEVIRRLQAFEAVGADVLYLGGVANAEDVRSCVKELKVPCTVPASWMNYYLAKELGLCEVRYPYEMELAMHAAAWEHIVDLKKRGLPAMVDLRERFKGNPYMAEQGQLRSDFDHPYTGVTP
jgi:2-methylisocitrate lyase-like PEP mutase family enzyme